MVPAQNLSKQQQFGSYGGFRDSYTGYDYRRQACLGSDLAVNVQMAEINESRTSSLNEAGSSSKDVEKDKDERWLQLGLASCVSAPELEFNQVESSARRSELVELDLLPTPHVKPLAPIIHVAADFRTPNTTSANNISTSLFLQHPRTNLNFAHQGVSLGYKPNPWSTSSSSSAMPPAGLYYSQPISDMRVVDAPPRPHSGVWFVLQASQEQVNEPFLPQISKSYLRIKDGRMTVRFLMKYLVKKLRLSSESEIEIRCRGQQIPASFTLQHVRDNIWSSSRDATTTLLPHSSTTEHVMILQYYRSA